jgi:predicted nucleic acid-binding protein
VTDLLLDASVWLAAVNPAETRHAESYELVDSAPGGAVTVAALDLTLYEVANVAIVRWRSDTEAARVVELVRAACGDELETVDEELVREASLLALEHDLTVYDAAYVASSRRRGRQLVSCDEIDLVRAGFAITPADVVGA